MRAIDSVNIGVDSEEVCAQPSLFFITSQKNVSDFIIMYP